MHTTFRGSATPPPVPMHELVRALATSHHAAPPVRAALVRCVRAARDSGVPPERVVVGVKEALRPYERRDVLAAGDGPGIREQLVRWAIAAYYRAD